jgi:NADPH:quinone reductase
MTAEPLTVPALVVPRTGGSEVLTVEGREIPAPGPGQVRVTVAAAGINFIDIYHREGVYPMTTPFVVGGEGAGTVEAVGEEVDISVGDRVAWAQGAASAAGAVVVEAASVVPVPDRVDLETAAAVMLQGITAHYLCHSTYPVAPGDTVVVHAAAGGVGLLLTQMVKMRGGIVIATTSTPAKAELARQAGADHLAGYEEFGSVAERVTGGSGVAVVYDGVGRATFDASLAAVRPRGLMVLYGGSSGPVPPFELQRLAGAGSLFITRPTMIHYIASRDELLWRTGDLFTWIKEGRLSVRIGGTYPLADAARAHDDLAARRTTGKLLLLPL